MWHARSAGDLLLLEVTDVRAGMDARPRRPPSGWPQGKGDDVFAVDAPLVVIAGAGAGGVAEPPAVLQRDGRENFAGARGGMQEDLGLLC